MNITAILLLIIAACLVSAYFGPFGRKYSLLLWLGLALGTQGASLLVARPYSTWGKLAAGLFALAFVYAYLAHVRARLATLHQERALRADRLVGELQAIHAEVESSKTEEVKDES